MYNESLLFEASTSKISMELMEELRSFKQKTKASQHPSLDLIIVQKKRRTIYVRGSFKKDAVEMPVDRES